MMLDFHKFFNEYKIFSVFSGDRCQKALRKLQPIVDRINAYENEMQKTSDEGLREKIIHARLAVSNGQKLDNLLPEIFAVTREAAWRVLKQRPFDVQLMGGMVLHQGNISEMKTGEGKTLAATLPAVLNALAGRGVHIVTVNDYLAKRDSAWMGQIYEFLGLKTGCILHEIDDEARLEAYQADITYGTNNEFGFDYLRDNMRFTLQDMVQRGHAFAIIDEVDSILIDEARTPLIISGPVEDKTDLYVKIDRLIPELDEKSYELDEKANTATLAEDGNEQVEALLRREGLLQGESLYDAENVLALHHINQALRAHKLFQRDRDYIVRDNKVIIIDEFTGRMMAGRRYSDGLHQAIEAKERVHIEDENQTLASITFQNYFGLYEKLAGMTGTAMTERDEFLDIYNLDVIAVPTHLPVKRIDEDDEIYLNQKEKYQAIVNKITECHRSGQPVLVGTTSISKSEYLSSLLKAQKIPHNVLNARYHEQEAQIIAEAGTSNAITIATNMAGRGTDIQLGGNPTDDSNASLVEKHEQVKSFGGLFVLGTERHESRRIDNQLRGRSGRQGDPGGSRFYLSLEDDLMRIFGSDKMSGILQKLGLKQGEAIIHPWVNKALEKAQKKVEARNFDIRKNLLKFDNVMNDQRKVVFEQRLEFIRSDNVSEIITDMRDEIIDTYTTTYIPEKTWPEEWETKNLEQALNQHLAINLPITQWSQEEGITDEIIQQRIMQACEKAFAEKFDATPAEITNQIEKAVLLRTIDAQWRQHLQRLEYLRQIIGLRSFGQRDPLNEYKSESFELFEHFLDSLRKEVVGQMMNLQIVADEAEEMIEEAPALPEMELQHAELEQPQLEQALSHLNTAPPKQQPVQLSTKTPRNAPCPCGSGKKYKHCCGR